MRSGFGVWLDRAIGDKQRVALAFLNPHWGRDSTKQNKN